MIRNLMTLLVTVELSRGDTHGTMGVFHDKTEWSERTASTCRLKDSAASGILVMVKLWWSAISSMGTIQ